MTHTSSIINFIGNGMVTASGKCRNLASRMNSRRHGITGITACPYNYRAHVRAHHVKNACYACYAVTALIYKGFFGYGIKKCRNHAVTGVAA
jgi:hypothetical protein